MGTKSPNRGSKLQAKMWQFFLKSNTNIKTHFLLLQLFLHHINQECFKTLMHEGEGKTHFDASHSLQLLEAMDIKLLTGPGQQQDVFPKHESAGNYHLYAQHQVVQKYKKYCSLFSGVQKKMSQRLNVQTNISVFLYDLKLQMFWEGPDSF